MGSGGWEGKCCRIFLQIHPEAGELVQLHQKLVQLVTQSGALPKPSQQSAGEGDFTASHWNFELLLVAEFCWWQFLKFLCVLLEAPPSQWFGWWWWLQHCNM